MISRKADLGCSADEAFAAFTDGDEIRRWWGDAVSYRTVEWHGEPIPGSRWRAVFVSADGQHFAAQGVYETVDRPAGLDLTWSADWAPGIVKHVAIRFDPGPDGTGMVVTCQGHAGDEQEAADGDGWDQLLGWFSRHVALRHG